MIRPNAALVLTMLCAFAPSLEAQRRELHPVAQGERVRVIVPRSWRSAEMEIGTVEYVSADSIVLQVEGSGKSFATPSVRGMRVDVSRGRGDPRRGAGFGALTGLVAGLLVGYAAGEDCGPQSFVCFDRSETVPAFALGGMVAGAVLGALMNAGERWERARLPSRGQ